ncbi:MAG TPA: DUF3177 family protein [Chroococcidiopsis sp.]
MSEVLLRSLIWTDFRVAVLFAVILPLILLVWAFVQQMEAIQRLMIIYWRVSSLLMITVYLLIGNLPISFIAALIARLLIPLGLWFWVDLNEEIDDQPANPFKLAFTSWRWCMTVYSLLGAVTQLFFLPCALSNEKFTSAFCQAWRQPPLLYQQYFHAGYGEGLLGFAGISGLVIYMLYLGYFVVVRLGRQGRSAIQP